MHTWKNEAIKRLFPPFISYISCNMIQFSWFLPLYGQSSNLFPRLAWFKKTFFSNWIESLSMHHTWNHICERGTIHNPYYESIFQDIFQPTCALLCWPPRSFKSLRVNWKVRHIFLQCAITIFWWSLMISNDSLFTKCQVEIMCRSCNEIRL